MANTTNIQVNLIIASSFAAFTSHCTVHGVWSQLHKFPSAFVQEASFLIAALIIQSVVEYWWHILMHRRFCYRHLHKHHHFYTSPEPFDDMYIHPLEGECIMGKEGSEEESLLLYSTQHWPTNLSCCLSVPLLMHSLWLLLYIVLSGLPSSHARLYLLNLHEHLWDFWHHGSFWHSVSYTICKC